MVCINTDNLCKQSHTLFCIFLTMILIILTILPLTLAKLYDYPKDDPADSTPRLTLFPPGATLTLTPLLTIPITGNDFGLGTSFMTSLPITITFDKLSLLRHLNDLHGMELTLWDTHKNGVLLRKKRNTSPAKESSLCHTLSLQKLALFRKMEEFMNPHCLLRTICEIYHYPVVEEFGILGEVVREVVGADRSRKDCAGSNAALEKYIKAQKNGERGGGCGRYHANCTKSLFYLNGK